MTGMYWYGAELIDCDGKYLWRVTTALAQSRALLNLFIAVGKGSYVPIRRIQVALFRFHGQCFDHVYCISYLGPLVPQLKQLRGSKRECFAYPPPVFPATPQWGADRQATASLIPMSPCLLPGPSKDPIARKLRLRRRKDTNDSDNQDSAKILKVRRQAPSTPCVLPPPPQCPKICQFGWETTSKYNSFSTLITNF